MGCLLALLALITPRIVIVLLFLFSDYLARGYQNVDLIWPILGFFFLPMTMLAYAFAINSHGSVDGIYMVLIILAVLFDVGAFGGSASVRSTNR